MRETKLPDEYIPVLAYIAHCNPLGTSYHYEVVRWTNKEGWESFAGSLTFEDGEEVLDWVYCTDVLPLEPKVTVYLKGNQTARVKGSELEDYLEQNSDQLESKIIQTQRRRMV
ncbi:hypothetical protein ACQ4M3_09850 [Leptolyngbya sp. AN03gr2]|uniref:hypothetical protein n=1 Tax=Leptolyngbya sp. AN03gr2 TaxID=3423364 RepID=UPI003D313FBC